MSNYTKKGWINHQENDQFLAGQIGGKIGAKELLTTEIIHKHLQSHHTTISRLMDRIDSLENRVLQLHEIVTKKTIKTEVLNT